MRTMSVRQKAPMQKHLTNECKFKYNNKHFRTLALSLMKLISLLKLMCGYEEVRSAINLEFQSRTITMSQLKFIKFTLTLQIYVQTNAVYKQWLAWLCQTHVRVCVCVLVCLCWVWWMRQKSCYTLLFKCKSLHTATSKCSKV